MRSRLEFLGVRSNGLPLNWVCTGTSGPPKRGPGGHVSVICVIHLRQGYDGQVCGLAQIHREANAAHDVRDDRGGDRVKRSASWLEDVAPYRNSIAGARQADGHPNSISLAKNPTGQQLSGPGLALDNVRRVGHRSKPPRRHRPQHFEARRGEPSDLADDLRRELIRQRLIGDDALKRNDQYSSRGMAWT